MARQSPHRSIGQSTAAANQPRMAATIRRLRHIVSSGPIIGAHIHMLETLSDIFKNFQNLIGTVVGFAGVCLTLWYNAHVAEKRRAAEIAHDRNTTRVTLSSEVTVIQNSLKDWKEILDQVDKDGQIALPRSFDADGASRGYRASLNHIGLLTENEIRQSVLAYSQYEALSKMSHDMQKQFDPDKPTPALRLAFQAYRTALKNTLAAVDECLDTIKEAKIVERAQKDL